MRKVIIGIVALVLIAAGAYLLTHKSKSDTGSTTATTQSQTSSSSDTNASTQNEPNTITFDGNQFSPSSLSVKAGTQVTIKNTSNEVLQFDSDPHPAHTDDTDLNVENVSPGQSKTFTVTKTGTFGFHDHLNPTVQGRITIE